MAKPDIYYFQHKATENTDPFPLQYRICGSALNGSHHMNSLFCSFRNKHLSDIRGLFKADHPFPGAVVSPPRDAEEGFSSRWWLVHAWPSVAARAQCVGVVRKSGL